MDQRQPQLQQMQQNRRAFFSSQNEQMLNTMLSNNFTQKTGSRLNDAQSSRLERGLEHYMSEVFQANPSMSVQTLNKEVLAATASDFNEYLQRQDLVQKATPQAFQEASDRFDQMQQDRQRSLEPPRPSVPDYVQPILIKEDESTTALTLFEEAKKRRNMEMSAQADEQLQRRSASAMKPLYLQDQESRPDPRALYSMPLDLVAAGQQNAQQNAQQQEFSGRADINPTIARPGPTTASRSVLQQDMIIKQEDIQAYKETEYNLSIYSADRNWEGPLTEQNRFNFTVNLFSGNSPTGLNLMPKSANRLKNIVRIEFVKAVIPIEATDIVVRKVNSTDKPNYMQALLNAQAVAITSVNAGVSTASVPAANLGQLNLSKLIEYNNLMGDSPGGAGATLNYFNYDTTYVKSVYSYPFITLNVDELDTNTFGTNNSMDNAFGILQYDSNWTDNTDSLGFTSLIPKHMKCQRVFSPTPLATLNKMSIRLQQPNGNLVNAVADTLDINGLFLSSYASIRSYFSGNIDLSGTGYSDNYGEYIWIDSKKWFSRFQVSVGDRIQIRNLTSVSPTPAVTDLINFLQNTDGLIVAGTAFTRPITAAELIVNGLTANQVGNGLPNTAVDNLLVDGCNTAGYCRFIIVRGKFYDPTLGNTGIQPYGNQIDNSVVSTDMMGGTTAIKPGRLINLSKQTQLIFRVITREYDSTSLVRPDNL